MKNDPYHRIKAFLSDASYPVQMCLLALMACLCALMLACSASRTGADNGQPLRLRVGEIKEVRLATRSDTTWQLMATSDNQEVVDVSRKAALPNSGASAEREAVFLVKGVTVGTARVVFSEKQLGTDGAGQTKKTYRVTVDSK